jgi:hypothetical protein
MHEHSFPTRRSSDLIFHICFAAVFCKLGGDDLLFVIISNKYSLEAMAFALRLFFILLERLDE